MKIKSLLLCFLLLPVILIAQTIDPALLDMSNAQAFPAGPDKVYVRGIVYGGNRLAVILQYDGAYGAQVTGPFSDEEKLITDDIDLRYTTFRLSDESLLEIADVIKGNSAFRGLFSRNGEAGIELETYDVTSLPETAETRLAQLEAERKQLENRIAALTAERDNAAVERDNAVSALENAQETLGAAQKSARPEHVLFSGFRQGTPITGTWVPAAGGIRQPEAGQKMAAYAIPVPEIASIGSDTMFTFRVGTEAKEGWNGFGMHFAKDAEKGSILGFGDSFLLWVTADTMSAGKGAFLQLYRTGERINQIASYRISEGLPASLEIGLLYRTGDDTVELWADGKRKAEFDARGMDIPGTTLVLRTFGGPVTFSDFEVNVQE